MRLLLWNFAIAGGLVSISLAEDRQSTAPVNRVSDERDVRASKVEGRIKQDLAFLASDDMRGRGPGTGGLDRAAEFIAERWRKLDLDTNVFGDSPFQEFTIPGDVQASKPERNRLQWKFANGTSMEQTLDVDFRPLSLGANVEFTAPLAFVGYGITASQGTLQYDDYAGIDVRGKIVVMLRKEPQQDNPDSQFDGTKSSRHALFGTKIVNAKSHGASGVLFVNDRLSASNSRQEKTGREVLLSIADAGKGSPNETLPAMIISRQCLEALMSQSRPGWNLEAIENAIDANLQPQSTEIPQVVATGEVFIEKTTQSVKNVVATLAGHGSLKNEVVVIGAHFDHVGMGGPGSLAPGTYEVHNGADDNASGVAALLEVSRQMALAQFDPQQPRRRLVFIGFTAEERGLLGSRHYVAHPRYSMESTVAMLNLDMVGRMSDRQLVVFGTGTATMLDRLVDSVNASKGLRLKKQIEGLGPSDHQPFYERKVPVLHFFTGLHDDYHRPSDDFDKINTAGMVAVTDMVYQLGTELALRAERPQYVAVKGRANIRLPIERKAKLGIRMDWNDVGSAVEIASITPGSAAEKAGLMPGDGILKLDGERIANPEMMTQRLAGKSSGTRIKLDIQRDGRPIVFEIQLSSP